MHVRTYVCTYVLLRGKSRPKYFGLFLAVPRVVGENILGVFLAVPRVVGENILGVFLDSKRDLASKRDFEFEKGREFENIDV